MWPSLARLQTSESVGGKFASGERIANCSSVPRIQLARRIVNVRRRQEGMQEGRKEGRKEGNVVFNDALNTFEYGYMASDIW